MFCFVAEDDLWVAPLVAEGEPVPRAWRLTVDRTRVGHPRFSPDGREIAFTTWRSLDPEIYLARVEGGGPARRLTYWGSVDARVCNWTPEGEILAVSSHGQPFSYYGWAYSLPTDGSPGRKLPWGPVSDIAMADGDGGGAEHKTLLLTGKPPHEPASWKRYRGGATGRMWVDGQRLLPDLNGHVDAVMFVGDRIAFLSDHEGIGNVYSCLPDGSDLRRHSDHAEFYARHAATDGSRIVYQCAGDIWLIDDLGPDATPRPLHVVLGGPRAGRRTYQVPAATNITSLSVDTTGRASAVGVRGSLYWLTHRDGPARTIHDVPGVRVRMPEMLGATGRIAYITDAEGDDAIEIAELPKVSGGDAPRRLAAGKLGRVHELVSSPDGQMVAVAAHDGRLLMVDTSLEGVGEVVELVKSHNGPVRDLAFSPDSGWLTWSHPGIGRSLRLIKMARLTDGMVVEVTNGRFEDEQPVFTRDGRYLAFLSWRGFDPVYDVHTGDLSFPLGCRPHLVPLSSATPSPFALSAEGRPAAGGLDPAEHPMTAEGPVLVELEGLASRVTPFPVQPSKYSALRPVAGGGLVWLRWPISGALGETFVNPADTSGRPTLEHFDLVKAKRTELTGSVDSFALSGDGTRLVVNDEGELRAVPANDTPDVDSTVFLDPRRILHEADPGAEWRQAFDEAGRIIRAYFWDPDLSHVDWDGVLTQYRPLVERVASPDEFADLLREVLGELGTSHAYVTGGRRNEGPPHYQRAMGLLGANLVCREGRWMLGRILPGDSSDSRARSPLAGTGVREGATLTHVDGRPVDPVAGPGPLMSAAGGTTVELTFDPPEGTGGAPRRIAVVPLIDERPLRYQDWVAKRREVVRELSDGRCGYLHIPDMGGSGWAQFNRDVRMEMSMPSLIVDVRGNAGGNISELVIEKLTRTIVGWDLTRDAQPVSYASNAPRGPVVAVADEMTSSDGDMITAAFKLQGIGPVVGTRTWGGVVGMTGRHRLVDGTSITVPMNAAWFDAYGWSVENHGVAPDIDALRSPLHWAEGRHPTLGVAVRTALELLERHPATTPPDLSDVPDRSRPRLPGRGVG
ncbi:S41 family peptidase [Streptomyces sp. NPDC003077]|uniref:S41 family peptidase n=1 Tax=Streptomyces sp. NPDC003077 TaxID=3154443 RepID=UPI0033AB8619